MKALFFLPLAACVSAQVVTPFGASTPYAAAGYAAPWAHKSQYHAQDELGQVSFGHTTFDQTRSEVRLWNGQVQGHYSYIDANGEPAVTHYEAGPDGYRVVGSNNLPVGHAADKSVPDYTPEVAAARAEFSTKFEETKAAVATAAAAIPAEPSLKAAEEPAVAEAAVEPTLKAEPAVAAEPVVAAEPALAAEPVVAAEPALAAEPVVAVEPALTAEPAPAAKPALAAQVKAAPKAAVDSSSEEEDDDDEPVVKFARKKREIVLPALAPALTKTTVETKQYEPVEAAVPADTTKIDLTTKEHEVLTYAPTPIISTGVATPHVTLKGAAGLPLTWGGYPYFPFFGAPSVKTPSRRRRQVALPLPYLHAVPTTTKVSYTTSHFEPKETATPADTMFLGKVTKEHELAIPSVRYVQPTVKVQPITYRTAALPSFMPFAANPFMTSPLVTLKAK